MSDLTPKRALAARVPGLPSRWHPRGAGAREAPAWPAFSDRERRWMWLTDWPCLALAVAAAIWLPEQRPLSWLVCLLLLAGLVVASYSRIALPDNADAAATQLVFVPILFLAPLNLVALMVLAGYLIVDVLEYLSDGRPLARAVLSLGNSSYALAPVLVLAAGGHETFDWKHWLVYAAALAAQVAFNAAFSTVRVRLHAGTWLPPGDSLGAPAILDVVLSLPALAVVAVAAQAPVAAVLIAAALLAITAGFTSERSRRVADRERAALDARRALLDERVRIARELHDVVAHHVSVIGVQAGAARMVLGRDPDRARETLASIESSSREAVLQLHQLLGFLRQAGDADDLGPQPGLEQLRELTAAVSASQLVVDLRIEGEPFALAPTVDASAYRIVQEALTNTLKHAGATQAAVTLRYGPGEVELEIVDDGRATGAGSPAPGGLGLIGMRERAALHGGRLETGPREGGGFAVRATLPAATGAP
jgi:signal transduction histidine kinase